MQRMREIIEERDHFLAYLQEQFLESRIADEILLSEQDNFYRADRDLYEEVIEWRRKEDYRMKKYIHPYSYEAPNNVDNKFREALPITYKMISLKVGEQTARWDSAIYLANKIDHFLTSDLGIDCLLDCRAKSNLSIRKKMREKHLDSNEVFDQIGIRCIVKSEEDGYRILEGITQANPQLFRPMPSHRFHHRKETHEPVRDFLKSPKPDGYAALHLTLVTKDEKDNEVPFELRIIPRSILISRLTGVVPADVSGVWSVTRSWLGYKTGSSE